MVSISTDRSPLERSGSNAGARPDPRSAASPLTANARVYGLASLASVSSAGSARLSSSRWRANATGHQRTRGWPLSVEHRGRDLRSTPSDGRGVQREAAAPPRACRDAPSSSSRAAARARRTGRPAQPAGRSRRRRTHRRADRALRPPRPARAVTRRQSAAISGSRARASPSRPSANAAICRTSDRGSARTPTSGVHALGEADAANGQRGTPSDARLVVRRAGGRRRVEAAAARPRALWPSNRDGRGGRDGGRGVAKHALILESEDPGHLFFEGGTGSACTGVVAGGTLAHADANRTPAERRDASSHLEPSDRRRPSRLPLQTSLQTFRLPTSDCSVVLDEAWRAQSDPGKSTRRAPVRAARRSFRRRPPRSADRSDRDRSSACWRRCRPAARSSAASTRWMLAARPMPDSSMPPCHTGMPCAAHRSCSRIDSAKPPTRPGLMLMMRQAPAASASRATLTDLIDLVEADRASSAAAAARRGRAMSS